MKHLIFKNRWREQKERTIFIKIIIIVLVVKVRKGEGIKYWNWNPNDWKNSPDLSMKGYQVNT